MFNPDFSTNTLLIRFISSVNTKKTGVGTFHGGYISHTLDFFFCFYKINM